MKSKRMVAIASFASLLLGAFLSGGLAQACPQPATARKIESKFTPLDLAHNLYAVSGEADYALHVVCSGDQIVKIGIVPKSFFRDDHPDWVESSYYLAIPVRKYQEILDQIGQVQSLGSLRQPARIVVQDNLRGRESDEYEGAIVERAMLADDKVAWFYVKYFCPVSGKLQSKSVDKLDRKYIVTIDGEPYWTRQSTFEKLKVGKQVSIEAARTSDP